jgi:hypothetical protein
MSLEARGARRHDSNKSSMVRETTECSANISQCSAGDKAEKPLDWRPQI